MRIERLAENHPRAAFESGNEVLDTWFREQVYVPQRQDTARTFVLIDDDEQIAGYYSLAMGGVESIDAPRRLTHGLPRFPVPIVLVARLAIDRGFQGHGLGMGLLFEALHRAALAAEHAAARLIPACWTIRQVASPRHLTYWTTCPRSPGGDYLDWRI